MRCYIDPGTGSMLFTILIGLAGGAVYLFRTLFLRAKFLVRGGRKDGEGSDRLGLVVFSDDQRYWSVFEPVVEALDEAGQEVHYWTASEDDPALEASYPHLHARFIGHGSKAFTKMNYLSADVVLSTTPSLDVFQWKRSKHVKHYVHLPHAASDITIYRMFGLDYYDAVLLSGTYQIRQIRELEALRGLPEKECRIVGIPYMDALAERFGSEPKLDANAPRTLLLAPSWGENGILKKYGARMLDALLATGYQVIIRPHPQSWASELPMLETLMAAYPDSDRLEWNRDRDNYEVLRRSDLLISDFSGVIFDFALIFDKPIIYADTSFDTSPYDCWWSKEPLWTFEILPKLGPALREEDLPRLKSLVDDCIASSVFQEGRQIARAQTWANPGEGAQHVAAYLTEKLQSFQTATQKEPEHA